VCSCVAVEDSDSGRLTDWSLASPDGATGTATAAIHTGEIWREKMAQPQMAGNESWREKMAQDEIWRERMAQPQLAGDESWREKLDESWREKRAKPPPETERWMIDWAETW